MIRPRRKVVGEDERRWRKTKGGGGRRKEVEEDERRWRKTKGGEGRLTSVGDKIHMGLNNKNNMRANISIKLKYEK